MADTNTATKDVSEQGVVTDAIEALDPSHTAYTVTVEGLVEGFGPYSRTFVQRPLSYFAKLEFFALLGKSIEQALSAEEGTTVTGVIDTALGAGGGDFDNFVMGLSRLAQHVPDLLEDAYCIWLGVPKGERELVKLIWQKPEDEGGMSDEVGMTILEVFVEQNAEAVKAFFARGTKLVKSLSARLTEAGESLPSKPSRRSARSTAKA
jgi:hypothetical protein